MIAAILADLIPYAIGGLAVLAALLGYGRQQRNRGRDEARHEALESTINRAADTEADRLAIDDWNRAAGRAATSERLRDQGDIIDG